MLAEVRKQGIATTLQGECLPLFERLVVKQERLYIFRELGEVVAVVLAPHLDLVAVSLEAREDGLDGANTEPELLGNLVHCQLRLLEVHLVPKAVVDDLLELAHREHVPCGAFEILQVPLVSIVGFLLPWRLFRAVVDKCFVQLSQVGFVEIGLVFRS